MSKADYPYADDEFDAPQGPDVPRGVHRAPRSAWSRWWPFVVVIIVVPAIAYALVTWASRDNGTSDDDGGAPTTSASASVTPKASATPKASDKPSDDESTKGTPSDEPSTSDEPTAAVELGTAVTVYNAAGVSGLAASLTTELKSADFTNVTAANFSGTKPGSSTIYYASEDLEPTAALVGQTIGVDALEYSPSDAGAGISAVLVTDPRK